MDGYEKNKVLKIHIHLYFYYKTQKRKIFKLLTILFKDREKELT